MALKTISENTFNSYNFDKLPNLLGIASEQHWFADDEAHLLGTVLIDHIDKDYSIVLMALDEDGEYRAHFADASIESERKAIETLKSKMISVALAGRIEDPLYESTLFDPKAPIIITDINEEIKRFFQKNPHKLYDIHPRKFEELIASIMQDLGFDIHLTKTTRDGGRDIIASFKNSFANFLTYVECKRYAPDRKIDVGIIREVQGIHYTLKPAKSIIVTTSFFTKDAVAEAARIENQLELKDFNNIKEWLSKY